LPPAKPQRESSTGAKEPKSGIGKFSSMGNEEQKKGTKTTEKAVTRQGNAAVAAAASPSYKMK